MYLKIQSIGEIEQKAFTLLGGSTKDGQDKIGMFGSGLKYSISSLLRNGVEFKVFSGTEQFNFETKPVSFRENNFDIIHLNGEETSFTTSMGGKDWDIAFAPLREIYSNALDESDNATMTEFYNSDCRGREGYTTFYIEMNNLVRSFYNNKEAYFSHKRKDVLFANKHGAVYSNKNPESALLMYRKGIRCHYAQNTRAMFSYNSPLYKINESRVLQNYYNASSYTSCIWKLCENKSYIKQLMLGLEGGNAGWYEHELKWEESWMNSINEKFSDAWAELAMDEKYVGAEHVDMFTESELKGRLRLPFRMIKAMREQFPDMNILGVTMNDGNAAYHEVEQPSQFMIDKTIDAMSILMDTDYNYRLDNPKFKYVKFSSNTTLAMAKDGKIFLSVKLEDSSVEQVAKIIIEENEHNKTSHEDCTREFQDHLFDIYYEQLKRS